MIVPFFIPHQGCGHRCVFCNQNDITGDCDRIPSGSELLARIAHYRASDGDVQVEVAFFGGTFTALPRPLQESLLRPLQPLLVSGEVSALRVSTRPDEIDEKKVSFLREMGVGTVELGIQSMDDEVLEFSGRGHTAEVVEQAFRVLKLCGMKVGAQLMPGLPGDTPVRSLTSMQRVIALDPDFFRIYPTLVLAGTKLASLYLDGLYAPLTLASAVKLCKLMLHRALKASIPVIRIGLQPTDALMAEGVVIAGPLHPAFRQLVESELCYDLLVFLAGALPRDTPVTIVCASERVSDVSGQRRANIERLGSHLGVRVLAVAADRLFSRHELELRGDNFSMKGNIVQDLHYNMEDISIV